MAKERKRIEVREGDKMGEQTDVVIVFRERRMQLFLTYVEMVQLAEGLNRQIAQWVAYPEGGTSG